MTEDELRLEQVGLLTSGLELPLAPVPLHVMRAIARELRAAWEHVTAAAPGQVSRAEKHVNASLEGVLKTRLRDRTSLAGEAVVDVERGVEVLSFDGQCTECRPDLSCKGRGFCPGWVGQEEGGAVDAWEETVLPDVPHRQWALTVSFARRMGTPAAARRRHSAACRPPVPANVRASGDRAHEGAVADSVTATVTRQARMSVPPHLRRSSALQPGWPGGVTRAW